MKRPRKLRMVMEDVLMPRGKSLRTSRDQKGWPVLKEIFTFVPWEQQSSTTRCRVHDSPLLSCTVWLLGCHQMLLLSAPAICLSFIPCYLTPPAMHCASALADACLHAAYHRMAWVEKDHNDH